MYLNTGGKNYHNYCINLDRVLYFEDTGHDTILAVFSTDGGEGSSLEINEPWEKLIDLMRQGKIVCQVGRGFED